MFNISDYLSKFHSLLKESTAQSHAICEEIQKTTGAKLSQDTISIQGTTVYITASPVVKNEIVLHKSRILSRLHTHKHTSFITEIR